MATTTTESTLRTNKYAGPCIDCGLTVGAGLGHLVRTSNGWGAQHLAKWFCERSQDVPSPLATNRYPGKCGNCGIKVLAEEGVRELSGTRWVVWHREGQCPTQGTAGLPAGRYALEVDGDVKFYQCKADGLFAQASDELHRLTTNVAAVAEAIIAAGLEESGRLYGRELGRCCKCGRTLTSEWRKEGIGPVCANA
jgi:hypothetical protein